ncbi:MAG: hypothetical protein WC921_03765 [Candidatus Paceibacterota bacterium]|jgi:cytoskeletal protein RodZ
MKCVLAQGFMPLKYMATNENKGSKGIAIFLVVVLLAAAGFWIFYPRIQNNSGQQLTSDMVKESSKEGAKEGVKEAFKDENNTINAKTINAGTANIKIANIEKEEVKEQRVEKQWVASSTVEDQSVVKQTVADQTVTGCQKTSSCGSSVVSTKASAQTYQPPSCASGTSGCCNGNCGQQTTVIVVVNNNNPTSAQQVIAPPAPPPPPTVSSVSCTINCHVVEAESNYSTVSNPPVPSAPVITGSVCVTCSAGPTPP